MEDVLIGRILTGLTLGVHILYATVGVGIPLLIMVLEFLGIKKNDYHYLTMARRIAMGYTVTVAVGVVTGTIIGLQLSLIWPQFMQLAGHIIALPLFMETFAFFFEAIFLGIYLYTWDRFKNRWHHWYLTIPVVLGAGISAVFITMVNSFMNSPAGFKIVDGVLKNVDPLKAMFNPSMPERVFHVLVTAYMTAAFIMVTIAAFNLLKSKFDEDREYHKKGLKVMMVIGLIMSGLTLLAGDLSAKYLHNHQPEKLAAIEWHFETEGNADLILFGVLDEENQEVKGALRIPSALSILSDWKPSTEVTGLNDIPKDEWPPLVIHYFFDVMVFFGMFGFGASLLYFILKWLKPELLHSKLMLYIFVLTGPLSFLAIEAGWFTAELGRQPWMVRGYMRVSEAITEASGLGLTLILFGVLYFVLVTTTILVLTRMFKDKSAKDSQIQYYGTESLDETGGRF
ncbi:MULTISPECIES: cytochrome ubiquinol oxidase subunit I [unclassified Nosocomiicoccus]|uniref:cytochrome ubiquinol oxidase subunit I n=1 Tax=unclassified Nosocomiicoccus TaxID=2646683 RepID=UPI0008A56A6E|nr:MULTISPECIES: cytochrome ubiquinol oxidase subunit I [unclassified Nosocomiicoccus]OFO51242.1 cytochrome D ubiquinol oxidase subunit I [Nosocomiicoccus sp. HMSC059G07]OFS62485.1 cytochrome D ubiquinol oxidase subunit I [Nosocomiicoccus sp. HMSC09A07]